MKILEYKIVHGYHDGNELELKVNDLIKNGWQPLGAPISLTDPAPIYNRDGSRCRFIIVQQSMVRYAESRSKL